MSQPIPLYPPEESPQVFPYLQEIVQRYRRNVHHLEPSAPPASLHNASERLGLPLPKGLNLFLGKWNGCSIFRNALQIRSTMELAFADKRKKNIVLFADTDNGERWAYAQDGNSGFVFGLWSERIFVPLHNSFAGWLEASLRLLDEGPFPSEQHLAMRKQFDPTSGYLFFAEAEASLREGRLEEAQQQVKQGLSLDRSSCRSWSLLGDCLRSINLKASYSSYLESIKRLHFPVPYLNFLPVDCRFIQEMSTLTTPEDDRWFVELRNIWNNRITDVRRTEEFQFVERIACTIAEEYVNQGAYFIAKEFLLAFLDKSEVFSCRELPIKAQLLLADIYIQLGNHDDAERLLRALQYTDERLSIDVNLRIARIATVRQEPWGLDILFSLLEQTRDPAHLMEIWLLAGQYYVELDDVEQASECIDQVQLLVGDNLSFACQLDLLCGDVARTRLQIGLAEQFYQKATSRNQILKNPILEGRILFHRGELLRRCDEHSKAQQYCLQALQIFQHHHCAFDEGLVLTSLGHYGKDSWLAAKKIFFQLDWAIGVSKVDQLMGDKSISWHIDQCQEHTRRRVRAQKALPPLQRLDAEMPERREFGHRMAIINYDESVLDTLSKEMLAAERELRSPSILPSHQKYARFVACVELISQYPSYRAGEIILRLVKDDHTIGIARKALLRILSRTRNISVVEGLMEIIAPGTIQAGRLIAIEALGWRKEQTAIPLLLDIVNGEGSGAIKRAAIIALGRIGDPSVIEVLLQHVDNPLIAEQTAISLLLLGEWSGLRFLSP